MSEEQLNETKSEATPAEVTTTEVKATEAKPNEPKPTATKPAETTQNEFNARKVLRAIFLVVIGIWALVLSGKMDDRETDDYAFFHSYGGDAYTGIQNAAAKTSKNVVYLNNTLKYGFQYTLFIAGLAFIAVGATTDVKED